ncbi:uncharacterized protein LOC135340127 isoform X2 [Halichondria panicea]|uniref:uncharacterized protein LOC135340127 isoform X2 n=1 Tax=Halichondria panicea TaxID=6063 RepID=UPI00312B7019
MTFFTVKHGADEEALFNPDCSLKLLVDSIKKRCNFPNINGGLADAEAEKFTIINLSEQSNEMSSCVSLFTKRGVYILLAIIKRDSGPPKYHPLLDNVDKEFTVKLDSLSNPKAAAAEKMRRVRSIAKNPSMISGLGKKKTSSSLSKSFSASSRGK